MTFPHSSDLLPMALTGDYEAYRDAALDWIDAQHGEWSCDDLARDVPATCPRRTRHGPAKSSRPHAAANRSPGPEPSERPPDHPDVAH